MKAGYLAALAALLIAGTADAQTFHLQHPGNVLIKGRLQIENGLKLTAGTLTLPTGSVTSAMILDSTILSADITDGVVTSADIANGTIVGGDVADDTLDLGDIADALTLDASMTWTVSSSRFFDINLVGAGSNFRVLDDGAEVFVVDDNGRTTISDDVVISLAGAEAVDVTGEVVLRGEVGLGLGTLTIASSGDGSPATATHDPSTAFTYFTCQDTDGCNVTMGETNPATGQLWIGCNNGSNVVNFADTASVSELAGAFAAGQYDCIQLMYVLGRWMELSRSNN